MKESAQSGRDRERDTESKTRTPQKDVGKKIRFCSIGNLIHFVSACHKFPDSWNHSVHVASWHFSEYHFRAALSVNSVSFERCIDSCACIILCYHICNYLTCQCCPYIANEHRCMYNMDIYIYIWTVAISLIYLAVLTVLTMISQRKGGLAQSDFTVKTHMPFLQRLRAPGGCTGTCRSFSGPCQDRLGLKS